MFFKKRYLVWTVLTLIILLATMFTVYASPLEERQREHEDLRQRIEDGESELEDMEQHEKDLQAQLQHLEARIETVERELRELSEQISITEAEIAVTEEELADAEARLEYKDNMLRRRLRAIHEHGSISFMEVLLNATSFPEFLRQMNDLRTIAEDDFRLLQIVQEEKAQVELKKANLEEQRSNLLAMMRDSLFKQEELATARTKQQQVLAAFQDEIQKQEEAIVALEEEAKDMEALIARLIRETRQMPARGGEYLLWPLDGGFQRGWITSGFGFRTHPITGARGSWHGGIDIGIPRTHWPPSSSFAGDHVYVRAAENGVVSFSGWHVARGQFRELPAEEDVRVSSSIHWWARGGHGFGRVIIIDHSGGLTTVYAHNYRRLVDSGDFVFRGQPIAIVGSTGASTGPHLHFEVHEGGVRVNPLGHLP